eukprot:jgi/Ulvmu1/5608/UM023_0145.1
MYDWISCISHVQLLDSPKGIDAVSTTGCSMLSSDHVVVYRRKREQYWAVAGRCSSQGPGDTELGPQEVGRGMVGYAALVGKDVRVADARFSSLYDSQAEDVTFAPLTHSVHPAAVAHSKPAKPEGEEVLIKAMRGWNGKSEPYSQDDMAMLRWMANSTQQVIQVLPGSAVCHLAGWCMPCYIWHVHMHGLNSTLMKADRAKAATPMYNGQHRRGVQQRNPPFSRCTVSCYSIHYCMKNMAYTRRTCCQGCASYLLQAITHQEEWWEAAQETKLASFLLDVHRAIGSELQLERVLDLVADVIAEVGDSEAGLIHMLQPYRRNPSFVTYSSVSGSRRGVC